VTLYSCTVAGCSWSYKTPGWLARHINSNHSGLAVPHCPIIPPPAVVAGVRLPNGEMASAINMIGQTPNVQGCKSLRPPPATEVLVGLDLYEVGVSV
jgi:hypothetical protein